MRNKRLLSVVGVMLLPLIVVTLPFVSSCAKPAPPAAEPAPTPGPPEIIELTFSNALPPTHQSCQLQERWAEELEKRTGGRVKVTTYFGGSLGKPPEIPPMVSAGAIDIGYIFASEPPGRFPLTLLINIPFVGPIAGRVDIATHLVEELLLTDDDFKAEWAEYKVIGFSVTEPMRLWSREKVTTLDDLKGMKIRTGAGFAADVVKAAGAVPVHLTTSEVYMGLERGIVDGLMTGSGLIESMKLYEVIDYGCWSTLWCGPFITIMNLDTWNSLPPDIQVIIEGLDAELAYWHIESTYNVDATARIEFPEKGVELYFLSDSVLEQWQEAAAPAWDENLARLESEGKPARKFMEHVMAIFARYE